MDCRKGNDYVIIMGEWNSVVRVWRDGDEIGEYMDAEMEMMVQEQQKLMEMIDRRQQN